MEEALAAQVNTTNNVPEQRGGRGVEPAIVVDASAAPVHS
jgi:hypothetical protein